ncbi:MAG: heme-binding domain-containing protein [Haliscomenobacter sp.]|nr:heme-binding domain-containing protein [Haliscomenobacter sp.]
MKKIIRWTLLALLGALVFIQFLQISKTNPAADPAQDYLATANPPEAVTSILKEACYDCHSNLTRYPWYSYVQPAGWFLKDHVDEGREHLNFSVWTTYPAKRANHKLEECFEVVESKEMPLESYTWMHRSAKLTDAQRGQLVEWFKAEYAKAENDSREQGAENGEKED